MGLGSHSRLEPIKKVANMLKAHPENFLTYSPLPVISAVAEMLNSTILTINNRACGYSNMYHFNIDIYFLLWRFKSERC